MGERLSQANLVRAERVDDRTPDLKHAEELAFSDQRNDDQRSKAVVGDRPVECRNMFERAVRCVVADDDRSTFRDREARCPEVVRLAVLVDGLPADVLTGAIERVAEATGASPDEIDPGLLGGQQPGSL